MLTMSSIRNKPRCVLTIVSPGKQTHRSTGSPESPTPAPRAMYVDPLGNSHESTAPDGDRPTRSARRRVHRLTLFAYRWLYVPTPTRRPGVRSIRHSG